MPNLGIAKIARQAAVLLLATFLVCWPAWGQSEYTVFGGGLQTCRLWTEHKNISSASQDSLARTQFKHWLSGYLTAYSRWVEIGSGPVSETNYFKAVEWIDTYCEANSLEDVHEAAQQLIFTMTAE